MIYLPVLFLGSCFINSILRYGWNVGALIYMVYFITGVASILLDANNLYQYNVVKMDIGIIPPIVYCVLLWFCISPFENLKEKYIREIVVKNPKILDCCVYFYFSIFMIIVVAASTRINDILFDNTFASVRQASYNEHESYYNHLSGIPRYICALSTFFLASSYFMILIFLYNVITRRKGFLFNLMTLAGSTCQLLTSLIQADRSQFVYWLFLFAFALTMFRGLINKGNINRLLTYLSPLVIIFLSYFVAVSISRWGESTNGIEGGSIIYAGQNFINFCNFLNICWDTPISFCEIFPLTYYLSGQENYFEWCSIVENYTHIFMANFPTFMGIICSISGPIVMFLYIIVFRVITQKSIIRKSVKTIRFDELIKVWIVVIVPLIGVFGHFYISYSSSIALFVWLYVSNRAK